MTGLVKVMSLPTCTATSNKYCSSCLPQYTLVTLIFFFFFTTADRYDSGFITICCCFIGYFMRHVFGSVVKDIVYCQGRTGPQGLPGKQGPDGWPGPTGPKVSKSDLITYM